jgi:mono/diheme cytochrome c family protein
MNIRSKRPIQVLGSAFVVVGMAIVTGQQSKPAASQPATERGREPYVKYGCYQCHGYEAQGGGAGPRIGPDPLPLDGFIKYVRRPTRDMPPYTEKSLSDEALKEIYAFCESRPRPAGRPALLKP